MADRQRKAVSYASISFVRIVLSIFLTSDAIIAQKERRVNKIMEKMREYPIEMIDPPIEEGLGNLYNRINKVP